MFLVVVLVLIVTDELLMAKVDKLFLEIVEGNEFDVLPAFFSLDIAVAALVISFALVVNLSFILVSLDESTLALSKYFLLASLDD